MKISEIKNDLNRSLNNQFISPKILLDKLRLIDENSRKSGQYQDPSYLPFYYHLSKFIFPKSLLQIGLHLALPTCCFLQGNKSVEKILTFQNLDNKFYSERLAISNIKDVSKKIEINYYSGKIFDYEFQKRLENKWDLIFINEISNEEYIKDVLNICWQYLNLDGIIVIDNAISEKIINSVFLNFCKIQNRECFLFKTRYGTGIIQK